MESKKNDFIQLYCFGCGIPLQNSNPNSPGYVSKFFEQNSHFLCQRCFRLQHYGINNEEPVFCGDYRKIIDQARREKALIIYVVDLFAFESSLISSILDEIKDLRVVIIASKRDIIPQSIKDEKLKAFIRRRLHEYDINPLDIITSSAFKNYNIDEIIERYNSLRKGKNVYVFGASSVGKSSLINSFLKNYSNKTNQVISTSPYPGTTLNVISVPIGNGNYIYDTPGILLENSIFSHIDQKLIKYIMPRREIKPRAYQLQGCQSLIIHNFVKIDFCDDIKNNLILYLSNDINITRSKLENSEKTFNNMIKNKQFRLLDRNIKELQDLSKHEIQLPNGDCDIVISGLLWIKIKGKGQKINIYAPNGVAINIRECKI